MIFRPLHSWRHQRSRLSGALFTLCAVVLGSVTTTNAGYTFTLIADSTGSLGNIFFDSVTLNSTGTAAFRAYLDNGSGGIFSGSGGALTTITVTSLPFASFANPSINQAGTVAFAAFPHSGFEPGIYAGNGGTLTTIAETFGQFRDFSGRYSTSINSSGAVAFSAALDTGPGGIFLNSGGTITPVLINSASLGAGNFSMNDAGTLAFRSGDPGRIVTFNAGVVTTIVDSSGALNYLGTTPSLNDAGTVAFVAGKDGIDGGTFGIYSGNGGPLTTIADAAGPFSSFGDFYSGQPSINDSGTVAFLGSLDAGGFGIYTGSGVGTSEVIGSGDALFGSTITGLSISPTSLNDRGQVAFVYGLANGTTGIAIATPVPEPSASLLFALSFGLSLARRKRGSIEESVDS